MEPTDKKTYRVTEFASLAGVTVRALRHYDRLGLLKPRRPSAGYRAYTSQDLETLEQIVALKFIGVPLRKIPIVRRGHREAIANAFGAQRRTLEAKQRLIARAIEALGEAETILRAGRAADVSLYRRIIEVIEMQDDAQEWSKTYRELVDQKIAHLKTIPKEMRDDLRQQLTALVGEIKASIDEDPAGPTGQAFATRWLEILKPFSDRVDETLASHFATRPPALDAERFMSELSEDDRARVKATLEPFTDKQVSDFIRRAFAARSGQGREG